MTPVEKPQNRNFNIWLFIVLAWIFMGIFNSFFSQGSSEVIPYNQFISLLNAKKINSVIVKREQIEGTYKPIPPISVKAKPFLTVRMEDPTLTQKLIQSDVRFEAVPESSFGKVIMAWLLPMLFMLIIWWGILARMGGGAQGQVMALGKSRAKVYVERDLKIKFSDVAGVDEAKVELQEVVQFLKEPKTYNRLGGRMPKGILLVGPPGTGKTLLARAVAGEASVAFFSINGSEFVEMFVGLGAARVRDLFVQARAQAPCIIFIDELDALGHRGMNALIGGHEEKEQTLNQLLAELDGFDPSQGIVLLGATNRPETLDPALLRSGRFDRQVMVDKPDRKGRIEILKIHVRQVKLSDQVSIERVADLTAGFSGADLANLVNDAALIATRRAATRIEQNDFTLGIERIIGGMERKSRVLGVEEKKRVAYHEMGHTTVSLALEKGETVHKVSVIPRGIGAIGYTMRRPIEDRYLVNKDELETKIAVLLGGRASEQVFFHMSSTGAADDLDKATEIARMMITRYGMSESLGLLTYDREVAPLLDSHLLSKSHDYSEKTAELIDLEAKNLIDRGFQLAVNTIQDHRSFIEESVRVLLEKETLDEDSLKALWNKRLAS